MAILEERSLIPICCKYCQRYTTYISFDMELHLFEIHGLRSDRTINDAINEGRRLRAKLDENSMQKLDLKYSKYLDKTSIDRESQVSIPSTVYEEGVRSWSQRVKPFNFVPIISVDDFFKDDYNKPYTALPSHSLEQSPAYPIVGAKRTPNGKYILLLRNLSSRICE